MRSSRFSISVIALVLVAAACSGAAAEQETTTTAAGVVATTTTTTAAPATTTEAPPIEVALEFEMPDGMHEPLNDLYSWLVDDRNDEPAAPEAMLAHVSAVTRSTVGEIGGVTSAELASGDSVAVARVDRDIILLVDDGAGWRVVGAALDGITPWLGAEPRMVLILGSDARVGQNQQRYRADSVHIVTVAPDAGAGAIVGFPRDSWVEGPDGFDKLTHIMAGRGPEAMLESVTTLTNLDIEGYFVTGFKGFTALITELGGLAIDLPSIMRSGNNWSNFPAGPQTLTPTRALQLARIRKGLPAGDFDRSRNQGLIMQAAIDMVQVPGIDLLPNWIRILLDNAWTDLPTEDVLTLAASIYFFPSQELTNMVLPGHVGTAGSASVVYIDDEAEDVYRDLEDDGLLTVEEDEG